jgi:hypothetical protein
MGSAQRLVPFSFLPLEEIRMGDEEECGAETVDELTDLYKSLTQQRDRVPRERG